MNGSLLYGPLLWIRKIVVYLLITAIVLGLLLYFVLNSALVVRKAADTYAPDYNISYSRIHGNVLTGVKIEDLLISQPDTGEQALEVAETLVRSGAVDIIVIDSVAALVPRAEIEGEMGDSHMGLQARLMSQALRKLTGTISKTMTSVIFINQIRMKIGVVFGNPETTTGGNALKFYSSVRLDIRRIGSIKDGQEVMGNRTRVRVVKNKMAPPFTDAEFDILYGEGISQTADLIDTGVMAGIIEKSGSWYSHDGERLGQGRQNAQNFLKDNPDIYNSILNKVKEELGLLKKKDEGKETDS